METRRADSSSDWYDPDDGHWLADYDVELTSNVD